MKTSWRRPQPDEVPTVCVVLLAGFQGGGAERVVSSLIAEPPRDARIVLVSNRSPDHDLYPVASNVERIVLDVPFDERSLTDLGLFRSAIRVARLVVRMRKALRAVRPTVVLAMLTTANLLTLVASMGLGIRVVVGERNDVSRDAYPSPIRRARRMLYRRAFTVTANAPDAIDAMRAYVPEAKLRFVPNPVVLPPEPAEPHRSTEILIVGRLVEHKQHALLIDAFSRMRSAAQLGNPAQDWTLTIVGDGPERASLEQQVQRLDLAHHVRFVGYADDPSPWYRRAAVFVIPSRYEGMPNALLEAMAHGLACLSADDLSGATSVIEDGVSGMLFKAGDPDDLCDKLKRLAQDPQLRLDLGVHAREAMVPHAPEFISELWGEILLDDEPVR